MKRYDLFGFLICGIAWGALAGASLFLLLVASSKSLRQSNLWAVEWAIECFCICVGTVAALGLLGGTIADSIISEEHSRQNILRRSWKLWVVGIILLGLFWGALLPAHQ